MGIRTLSVLLLAGVIIGGFFIERALSRVVERQSALVANIITNDSTSIDLNATFEEGEDPDLVPGSAGGGSGSGGSASSQGSGIGAGSDDTTPAIDTVTLEYDASGGGGADSDSESAEEFLATLIGNQAVSLNSSVYDEYGGDGAIYINAEAIRAALRARGVRDITLSSKNAEGGRAGRLRAKQDFALVAASEVLNHSGVSEIILSGGTLSLQYRARGRLFAVIPLNFRVRLALTPAAQSLEERVIVKFPWYKFFLQTYVSKKILQNELDPLVVDSAKDGVSVDSNALLLTAVIRTLEARFDTVEDSIQPRTP